MTNPLTSLSGLPAPVKFVGALATGGSVVAALMEFRSHPVFGVIIIGGLVVAGLAMAVYVLVLKYKDKVNAGKFLKGVMERSRGGAGGATDPAAKAKLDDLRKKFEEGVATFKQNGKDLYSLPWYVLVGPSGSGKTEAMRHCQIGYPPGLQDCLQGAGGTLNMHWWFSNSAVVIDTAGRMFMQESQGGGTSEWKEFLKLLKQIRPNCPINGMLLVISSESLLKDSAEKIEATAGAIARQLDVIQRTLEVRFPVYVVVTKCDKIVGFREFFERIDDPTLQHQMLGWSNPASLDEVFKPESVDKHLESVKEKLVRRRLALLQDPTHTSDPSARRADQVDELFELPDNLTRIAPRLRRYLEMIFMAGEWSPKPLFLRGIYFTSSMREGQALDTSLAGVLGVEVESLPGGREWDREKSYFLRDVFLSKVFKERGLVTRALNVSEQMRGRRRLTFGIASGAAVVLVAIAALGFVSFRGSVRAPAAFWKGVGEAYGERRNDLVLIAPDKATKTVAYVGKDELILEGDFGGNVRRKRDVIIETGERSTREVSAKVLGVSMPFLGGSTDGYVTQQARAHRALVEDTFLKPLIVEAQAKLAVESEWSEEAIVALAEMIRIQTYAEGFVPAEPTGSTARGTRPRAQLEADAFVRYLLTEADYRNSFDTDRTEIQQAVDRAYKSEPWGKESRPSKLLVWERDERLKQVTDALQSFVTHARDFKPAEGTALGQLARLTAALGKFSEEEAKLRDLPALRAGAPALKDLKEYDSFSASVRASLEAMKAAKEEADRALAKLCAAGAGCDPSARFSEESAKRLALIKAAFERFGDQLPVVKEGDKSENMLVARAKSLSSDAALVNASAERKLTEMRTQLDAVAPLCASGVVEGKAARAYAARFDAYEAAFTTIKSAAAVLAPSEAGVYRPMVAETEKAAAEIDAARAIVQKARGWQADATAKLSPEQGKALSDGRESACNIASSISGLAQGRWNAELAEAFLRSIPSDGKGVTEMMGEYARGRMDDLSADGEKLAVKKRPRLALTAMATAESSFDPKFHPDAGRSFFRDWDKAAGMMVPAAAGQPAVLGAMELKPAFDKAKPAALRYAREFAFYWRDVLLNDASPNDRKWSELAPKLRDVKAWQANSDYKTLGEEAMQAHGALTPGLAIDPEIKKARDDTAEALRLIDDEEYKRKRDNTIKLWNDLAANNAKEARAALLTAIERGRIVDYFAIYDRTGPHVHYWNEVIERSLDALILDTGGDIAEAKRFLTEDCKAVPVALGASERELTTDQIKRAKEAAETLGAPRAPAGPAQPAADNLGGLPANIKSKLASLQGEDFLRTEEAKAWLRSVKAVVGLMSTPKLQIVLDSVEYDKVPSLAAKAGVDGAAANARDGRDFCPYIRVVADGQPCKATIKLGQRNDDKPESDRSVALPAKTFQIVLWKEDPPVNQVGTIDIDSPWPIVREMLLNHPKDTDYNDKDKFWIVPIVSRDKSIYFWLKVTFIADGKPVAVPPPSEWPNTAKWP